MEVSRILSMNDLHWGLGALRLSCGGPKFLREEGRSMKYLDRIRLLAIKDPFILAFPNMPQ